jgi:hypothetical protein
VASLAGELCANLSHPAWNDDDFRCIADRPRHHEMLPVGVHAIGANRAIGEVSVGEKNIRGAIG